MLPGGFLHLISDTESIFSSDTVHAVLDEKGGLEEASSVQRPASRTSDNQLDLTCAEWTVCREGMSACTIEEEGSKEEDSPRWRQDGVKMAKMVATRRSQDGPKMHPDGPRKAQDDPKMAPDDPSWSQHGPIMALKASKINYQIHANKLSVAMKRV